MVRVVLTNFYLSQIWPYITRCGFKDGYLLIYKLFKGNSDV